MGNKRFVASFGKWNLDLRSGNRAQAFLEAKDIIRKIYKKLNPKLPDSKLPIPTIRELSDAE